MKNALPDNVFLFGASYAPYPRETEWPMEEWDRDLATMRKLHFNTIRVFAPWDRIEMEEGVFDYGKQDHLFDLAAKHGIRVILNFGGIFTNLCGFHPPRYLVDGGRCQAIAPAPSALPSIPSVQISPCMDDPLYRARAFEFMERTVRRYAGRDELLAWMIWNEPAAPFCYCPHTLAKFREYLRKKYDGDLSRLNEAWGTLFPVNFKRWDDIPAPGRASAMWADWAHFNQRRLSAAMAEIHALAGRCDPRKRPTTANLVYHLAALEGPVSSTQYGLDMGQAGQSMSIMGVSCYMVEHLYDPEPACLTAYKLSRLRSASQDEMRRMLVIETGVGPYMRQLTERQGHRHWWRLIAHNAKAILLFNYRSRLSDRMVGLHHLMKWDGSISRRAAAAGEFSKVLQDNATLLNRVYPERQAAILTLEADQIRMEGLCGPTVTTEYAVLHDSRPGAYKLLWDIQVPTDCLAENNLDELPLYKLLLLPMAEHMTRELADRIRSFVAAGGAVIAESPFAFRDGDGRLQYAAPGFGLEEVFGCRTRDRELRETASPIRCPDGAAAVCLFWSEYELCGGEALARYDNGEAAVVRNRYGKGTAILAGTEVFRQYMRDPQPAMTALLQREVLASGALPAARLQGACDNIEVVRLSGDGGLVYILINHNDAERRFRVELRDGRGPWVEIGAGRSVELDGEVTLGGHGVLAIKQG